MKQFLFVILFIFCVFTKAQESNSIPTLKTQKGFLAFDFLSIDMPTNDFGVDEDHMGFSGIHYNLLFNNFYTGIGMFGTVRGKRGGFFTLGVNAGYKSYITKKLFVDTGIHFGGGGGAGAPDGGGAFILPHLNLGYQFDKFSLTTGYSYVNFFDAGNIKSHQLNIAIQVPLDISYGNISDNEKTFDARALKESEWNKKSKRLSFMFHLNNLTPKGKSQTTRGESLVGKTIRLAGFEINSYFNEKWFGFAKFDGAYDGIPAGYMNIFLGIGNHISFNKNRTNILTKLGAGAGGGGGVESQGGILMYSDLSLEQHLYNNVYLTVNKGFLLSPNSIFSTNTFGAGIKYYTNINGVKDLADNNRVKFKGFEIVIKQDAYLNAKRVFNPTENLHQISLQLNYLINDNMYLTGQTSFANFGNAGAYAEGIVGLGFQTNYLMKDKINLFIQALAGGAGGGDISTGQGLIIKPSMGVNYKLNSNLALRTAGGIVTARGGDLNSLFVNLGISYRISFLKSN